MKHPVRQNIIAMAIFGTTGILRKYTPIPTGLIAFLRGLIAGIFLFIYSKFKKNQDQKIERKTLLLIMITGVLIGANWIMLFEAYNYASMPVATLLYYMAPFFITIFSAIFLKEKLTFKKTVCVLVALLGMFLISGLFGTKLDIVTQPLGVFLALLGAVTYGVAVILNKKIVGIDPIKKTDIQMFTIAVVLLPYIILTNQFKLPELEPLTVIFIIIIGVVNTGVAYLLYFETYDKLPAQTIAILSYIDPIVTLILSFLILKERLDIFGVIGMFLILGSAFISEYEFKKSR